LHLPACRIQKPQVGDGIAARCGREPVIAGKDAPGQVAAIAVAQQEQGVPVLCAVGDEHAHASQHVTGFGVGCGKPRAAECLGHEVLPRDARGAEIGHEHREARRNPGRRVRMLTAD
jgi:hypothetical protein